jgi:hypothetical protein
MKIDYIEKKIKKNLINKKFKKWDKDTIDYMITIYEINYFSNIRIHIYLLLNDYINWLNKNNKTNINIYNINDLINLKKKMENNIDKISLDYNKDDLLIQNINDNEEYTFDNIIIFLTIFILCLFLYEILKKNFYSNNKIDKNNHYIFPTNNIFNKDLLENPIIKTVFNYFLE